MSKKQMIFFGSSSLVVLIFVLVGFFYLTGKQNPVLVEKTTVSEVISPSASIENKTEIILIKGSLLVPFSTKDIDEKKGEVNPMGIVRFAKDLPEFGHGGIDIPLFKDAPITAVADGEIVLIGSADDPWDGKKVSHLLESTGEGEGLAFLYEHITPVKGLKKGDKIKKGDLLGTKSAPNGFTAHFQITNLFNNFQFSRDDQCWIDFLEKSEKKNLNSWWDKYRNSAHLIDSWNTNVEDGKFPFKGLLDTTKYPNGPQFCYPLGTDVR